MHVHKYTYIRMRTHRWQTGSYIQSFGMAVPAGEHKFTWRWVKDYSMSEGADRATLHQILITGTGKGVAEFSFVGNHVVWICLVVGCNLVRICLVRMRICVWGDFRHRACYRCLTTSSSKTFAWVRAHACLYIYIYIYIYIMIYVFIDIHTLLRDRATGCMLVILHVCGYSGTCIMYTGGARRQEHAYRHTDRQAYR